MINIILQQKLKGLLRMTNITARFEDENIKKEIEQLIVDEEDPKEKVRLLMLMQLNSTLLSNVVAVRNLTTEFKDHRLEFESHVSAGAKRDSMTRGAVWASVALIGVIQALSVYIFSTHMHDFDLVQTRTSALVVDIKAHEERAKEVDVKLNRLIDKLDRTSAIPITPLK